PSDPKTGQPDFKNCADCHMSLTRSHDAGNVGGLIHSHRFAAANTALPFANQHPDQLAAVEKNLTDGAVSVDLFALRRQKAGTRSAPPAHAAAGASRPQPTSRAPARASEPQAASLMGGEEGAAA